MARLASSAPITGVLEDEAARPVASEPSDWAWPGWLVLSAIGVTLEILYRLQRPNSYSVTWLGYAALSAFTAELVETAEYMSSSATTSACWASAIAPEAVASCALPLTSSLNTRSCAGAELSRGSSAGP